MRNKVAQNSMPNYLDIYEYFLLLLRLLYARVDNCCWCVARARNCRKYVYILQMLLNLSTFFLGITFKNYKRKEIFSKAVQFHVHIEKIFVFKFFYWKINLSKPYSFCSYYINSFKIQFELNKENQQLATLLKNKIVKKHKILVNKLV